MDKNVDFVMANDRMSAITVQKNQVAYETMFKQMSASLDKTLAANEKAVHESEKRKAKLEAKLHQARTAEERAAAERELATEERQYKNLLDAKEKYAKQKDNIKERAEQAAATKELNRYKGMLAQEKYEYAKTLEENIAAKQKALDTEIKDTKSAIKEQEKIIADKNASEEQRLAAKQAKANLEKDLTKKEDQQAQLADQAKHAPKASKLVGLLPKNLKASQEKDVEKFKTAKADVKQASVAKKDAKIAAKETAEYKKLQEAKKKGNKAEIEAARKRYEDTAEYQQMIEAEAELKKAKQEEVDAAISATGKEMLLNAGKNVVSALNKVGSSIDGNLQVMYGDQSRMMGRLQESGIDWAASVEEVSETIGMSGVASKKNVIQKMVELVDSGVAYNLEMRAFLAETAQDIASTFDAANGTLLRMVRLQQADSTQARLGMEATLTKLFNDFFQDSSYLAADISQQVSDAIIDASATMGKEDAVEFEYILQKWLGSLYSVGMSDAAVNLIAEGINYLGTGNVNALTGNESLLNLLTMTAARSGGKSFDQLLQGGLTGEDTNLLLKTMIELLGEIATGQNNNVTKSAFADLFGLSVTDLTVFASLTNDEINKLYANTQSYSTMLNETQNQLNQIASRRSLSQLVDTAIDNAEVGAAKTIGSNAFTYGTWKALSVLQDYVGEVKIPSVLAAGFGLSSDIDLINVAQTGLAGFGLIGSLIEGIGSMMSGGPTALANWSSEESTKRGGGLTLLDTSSVQTTSYSAVLGVGSASGSDAQQASLTSAKDDAYSNSNVSEEDVEEGQQLSKKMYELLGGDSATETVLDVLTKVYTAVDEINKNVASIEFASALTTSNVQILANPNRVTYTAITGVVSNANTVASLSNQLASSYYSTNSSATVTSSDSTGQGNTGASVSSAGKIGENSSELQVRSIADTLADVLTSASFTDAIKSAISSALSSATVPVNVQNTKLTVDLIDY